MSGGHYYNSYIRNVLLYTRVLLYFILLGWDTLCEDRHPWVYIARVVQLARYQYGQNHGYQETRQAHPQRNVQVTNLFKIGVRDIKCIALQVRSQPILVVALGNNGDPTLSCPSKKYLRGSWKELLMC